MKKNNKGFMLVSLLIGMTIASVVAVSMYTVILSALKVENRLIKLLAQIKIEKVNSAEFCTVTNPSCDNPVACFLDKPNSKDLTFCGGQCVFVNGNWSINGTNCLEILGK